NLSKGWARLVFLSFTTDATSLSQRHHPGQSHCLWPLVSLSLTLSLIIFSASLIIFDFLHESGDTKRLGKITKRGQPTFRDVLYQIGYHSSRHCSPIGHTYLVPASGGSTRLVPSSALLTKLIAFASLFCVSTVPIDRFHRKRKLVSYIAGRHSTARASGGDHHGLRPSWT
ncbi:MAG: IS110 family transposase, partial [Proteobacteria bacterium]|nr:IS110 family transposase [Pseudomonadota bacterium]